MKNPFTSQFKSLQLCSAHLSEHRNSPLESNKGVGGSVALGFQKEVIFLWTTYET